MPLNSTRGAGAARGYGLGLPTLSGLGPLPVLPNAGDAYEGGYFVGVMQNGSTRYALVISPKAQGQTQLSWSSGLPDPNFLPDSRWDGKRNCTGGNLNVVLFARGLNINGFNDWYVPAIDELDLMYRNLKPTTTNNVTGTVPPNAGASLVTNPNFTNPNSLPPGAPYTLTNPAQTPVAIFQAGGSECLDSTTAPIATWSSTFPDATNLNYLYFQRHDAGEANIATSGGNTLTVRAVRRVPI